jgi:hypothetical protein
VDLKLVKNFKTPLWWVIIGNPGRFAPNPVHPMSRFAICNGIFHISFFKALLINEGEATQGKRE